MIEGMKSGIAVRKMREGRRGEEHFHDKTPSLDRQRAKATHYEMMTNRG